MSIHVGEVISIRGVSVTIRIYEESSKDTLFYNGDLDISKLCFTEHL